MRIDCTASLSLNRGTTGQFAQIFVPDDYQVPAGGAFTLVLHLHGASWAAEDAISRARANAVLLNIHLGALSGPYQSYFSRPGVFQEVLDTVTAVLRDRSIIATPVIRKLLVTSFSAGYAGVREILRSPEHRAKIDALLLADGLHTSLDSALMKTQMQDFLTFALDARAGRKVFLCTHSSIPTSGYRSTTETADYLLAGLGLCRTAVAGSDEIGTRISAADTGHFHLSGYSGDTAADHMKHLYGMHRMVSDVMALLGAGLTGVRHERSEPAVCDRRVCPDLFHTMALSRARACQTKVEVEGGVALVPASAEPVAAWSEPRGSGISQNVLLPR
jgi:hypothetical protein